MTIWIFQTGEPLHSDGGNPRPMRAMNLANALIRRGHNVKIWSSDFYHQQKKHRFKIGKEISISEKLQIKLIQSCGYTKNISLKRFIDHAMLGKNLALDLITQSEIPDIGIVGFPPIEFASEAVNWLKNNRVPAVLDVKDQWPDTLRDSLPKMLRPLGQTLLHPYYKAASAAMIDVDAISTISNGFMDWINRFSNRQKREFDAVLPLSPVQIDGTGIQDRVSIEWWKSIGVNQEWKHRIMFVGSLSRAFDFESIYQLAKNFKENGDKTQFVICGNGPEYKNLSQRFSKLGNTVFPGWIEHQHISSLAKMSDFALAPYKNTSDFLISVPNKIIDYLALGKPLLTSLRGEVGVMVEQYDVGLLYDEGDYYKTVLTVRERINDSIWIKRVSENARELYRRQFDGKKIYDHYVDRLEGLYGKNKTLSASSKNK